MALLNGSKPEPEATSGAFSEAQKEYLDGFLRASAPGKTAAPNSSASAQDSEKPSLGHVARLAWLAAGKRLSREERLKHAADPLDSWDRIVELSARGEAPGDEDTFRFKFHGLFNVAPAQDGLMCRMRLPGGALTAAQLEAVADCAEAHGGGYADITTRANLQIREIPARSMAQLLMDLHDAGIMPRGSGADNIRNVTGSPTAGFDPDELYDVLPLCREMHHHILGNRDLYGLPRKFNVAFDGGGSISALEDTNDIGFRAARVDALDATHEVAAGTWFRVALGGITGHRDFARDTGLMLKPEECVPVASAMIKVFIAHGDRGNRNKARLKYVLDAKGFDGFLAETQKLLPFPLRRFPLAKCRFARSAARDAHLGIRPQRQPELRWVGAHVPAGRLTTEQMRGVSSAARQFARGRIRLTVWQNFLIPDVPAARAEECAAALRALGLATEADPVAAGIVACTGAEGCKYGLAPTKATSRAIQTRLARARAEGRLALDAPVNIHLTGCPHSCAQHFIGDIGLLATTVERDGVVRAGFHVFVGGGFQDQARIAVPARREVPAEEIPGLMEELLRTYLAKRGGAESFSEFTRRHSDAEIAMLFGDAMSSPHPPSPSPLHRASEDGEGRRHENSPIDIGGGVRT
ncbi:MAG TPA: NirA family protein [Fibrobacteria bacterium]|nr:NirA family protein [Fibrobacteria bacterium]